MITPQSMFIFAFAGEGASSTIRGAISIIIVITTVIGTIFAVSRFIKKCQSCFEDDQPYMEDEHLFLMVGTISRDHVLGQQCGVCSLGFWDANEVVVWRICRHKFHVGCIIEWYKANTTCPKCFCRESLYTAVFHIRDETYAALGVKGN
ncbi:hypothetical protein L6164_023815 [Bauhinia variegata]|uniref:Uncharacterized protein n=1 Tax=Bauhinia variegata TaxID=167791 RepID=A0ACB9MJP6_BAUVA|nr:hypothetical protein L6164_023815 [Bauhinia variegata]